VIADCGNGCRITFRLPHTAWCIVLRLASPGIALWTWPVARLRHRRSPPKKKEDKWQYLHKFILPVCYRRRRPRLLTHRTVNKEQEIDILFPAKLHARTPWWSIFSVVRRPAEFLCLSHILAELIFLSQLAAGVNLQYFVVTCMLCWNLEILIFISTSSYVSFSLRHWLVVYTGLYTIYQY